MTARPGCRTPTWSGSLSVDTERCRLVGMVPSPLRTASPATPRCCATSRAVLRVAVAVRPRKQRTPSCSRSTCAGGALRTAACLPARLPGLLACGPGQAHLADAQVAGPEVVGPLRDAVGFVNAGKGHRGQPREARRASCPGPNQRLRRQNQHLHPASERLGTAMVRTSTHGPPAAPAPRGPSPSAGQSPAASWSGLSAHRPPSSLGAGRTPADTAAWPEAGHPGGPFPKCLSRSLSPVAAAVSPQGPRRKHHSRSPAPRAELPGASPQEH